MNCEKCGESYTFVGNPDDGYARSICACQIDEKCHKCKRGAYLPVNQAVLDLEHEVRWYACSKHGHIEAEDLPVPGKPEPRKTVAVVAPVPVVAKPKPVTKFGMGPGLRGDGPWTQATWAKNMEAVFKELKGPGQDYKVICSGDNCRTVHLFGKRKLLVDNANFTFRIVCPKCGEDTYMAQ